jgi:outer membrane protein OmpA-like peptidoglycan-associated protein
MPRKLEVTCLVLLSLVAPRALGESAPLCPASEWAPRLPAKFQPYICRRRTWVPDQNLYVYSTTRKISGSLELIAYQLKGGIPREQGIKTSELLAAVRAKAKKLGAKEIGKDDADVMFEKTTPKGHSVYHVRWLEDGTAHAVHTVYYTTAREAKMPRLVKVRRVASQPAVPAKLAPRDCADPAWLVKGSPAYARSDCAAFLLDEAHAITFKTAGPSPREVKLTGNSVKTYYAPAKRPDDGGQLDGAEVADFVTRDFVEAFKAAGFQEAGRIEGLDQAYAHLPTDHGDFWYLFGSSGGNSDIMGGYYLLTVQRLEKKCTMQFYGVNFDFDKATIRPDSEPELQKMLALFTGDASYSAEVGGHTDSVGQPDYNLKLSGERAAAVKAWLVSHGIADGRVATNGYGDTKPLVPNDTDEHRAKNRRVELKREHCVEE